MAGDASKSERVALALGSNLGDRLAVLRAAVAALGSIVAVERASAIYETPPAYVTDQPAFLNAVIIGTTRLEPLKLLRVLKQTEVKLGRKESYQNGPRLIDIDIIFYGEKKLTFSDLRIPHPRLAEREFVLRPLADIASEWKHPVTGQTVEAMLAILPQKTARRLEESL